MKRAKSIDDLDPEPTFRDGDYGDVDTALVDGHPVPFKHLTRAEYDAEQARARELEEENAEPPDEPPPGYARP